MLICNIKIVGALVGWLPKSGVANEQVLAGPDYVGLQLNFRESEGKFDCYNCCSFLGHWMGHFAFQIRRIRSTNDQIWPLPGCDKLGVLISYPRFCD